MGPLRESPAFRRLWAGSTLSSVGSALTGFAVPLQVYDITRSAVAVGAIGVAQMVPTLTVGLLGGQLADAVDRRKLVVVTSSCLAVGSAAFAAQPSPGCASSGCCTPSLRCNLRSAPSVSPSGAPSSRTYCAQARCPLA